MTANPIDYQSLLKNAYGALDEMQKRLAAVEKSRHEPIAIVGMGCRFPGEASDPEAFWNLLQQGIDAITEVPSERWDVDTYYDPDPDAPGKYYTRKGGFLRDIDLFDAPFFRISPREATKLDPQQRLLMEVSWEALENAGCISPEIIGQVVAVFIGMTTHDYMVLQGKAGEENHLDTYFSTGIAHSVASGRISYFFDWHGPNAPVDTACSSSLVAVHLACQSLRNKECELALAGGVNLILIPDGTITTCRTRMMAFDGRCKTFDAAADGYVRGEGCGAVILKRLSDALASGDRILAVIHGTAMNQDGRSNGLTAPNGVAQETVIRAALADASISPAEVSYIEAHGTGTSLGDPIEMHALNAVYGKAHSPENPFYVASVKTNIGHIEGAAGIAGLIKLILCLQHQVIPPHLHFHTPNPLIAWDEIPVKIPTEPVPWPAMKGQRRAAGISSFGFSGTNVHMIVTEAPEQVQEPVESERPAHILTLSARTPTALKEAARRYFQYLAGHPDASLGDVGFTANTGRQHFDERLAVVAASANEAKTRLADWLEEKDPAGVFQGSLEGDDPPEVAFLFTGQGAQYAGMGRQLYESEPTFRTALEQCAQILEPLLEQPLLSVLYPQSEREAALLDQTAYTQPALFAIEYALARLWSAWGVEPSVVMGHSVGEYVAACLAGVFSLEEGLRLIAARGRLMQSLPPGGEMAAVFADEAQVAAAIQPYREQVSISALNGPANVVISGAGAAVRDILKGFEAAGVKTRPLTVSHAFHSPLMDPILEPFGRIAASVAYERPQIGLVSNITGALVSDDAISKADYWREHLRSPVQFSASIQTLYRLGYRVYLEIGPQPTLLGMGRRCLPEADAIWMPSIRPGRDDWQQMLESLASLYTAGVNVDWKGFDRPYRRRKLALPTYPFQRQRYWVDLQTAKPATKKRVRGGHPFLERQLHSPLISGNVYETALSTTYPTFLNDHRFFGIPLFPATGYLEMGMAAAAQSTASSSLVLQDVIIQEPLIFSEEKEHSVQTVIDPTSDDASAFRVFSRDEATGGQWKLHCEGKLSTVHVEGSGPDTQNIEEIRARCTQELSVEDYYRQLTSLGAEYGPDFQGVTGMWRGEEEAFGRLALPKNLESEAKLYHLHPVLLDASFHVLGAAFPRDGAAAENAGVYVPVGLDSYRVYQAGRAQMWVRARLRSSASSAIEEAFTADLSLLDDSGRPVAEIVGLQLRRVTRAALWKATQKHFDEWLYGLEWRPKPLEAPAEPFDARGLWLILADQRGVGDQVAARLRDLGAECVMVRAGTVFRAGVAGDWIVDPASPSEFQHVLSEAQSSLDKPYRGTIHLWGLDSVAGVELRIHQDGLKRLDGSILHLVQALAPWLEQQPHVETGARLWLVTCGAQGAGLSRVDPVQASAWGLANTIAGEYPELVCTRLDLDPDDPSEYAQRLILEIASRDREDQIAWRGQERLVARLAHLKGKGKALEVPENQAFQLDVSERGILDNLAFRPLERGRPGPGEVEVRVRASGLNFRDVLNVMGMYPGDPGPVGSECAGVVVAIGEGVSQFAVGDEVIALAQGAFQSHVIAAANLVTPKPAWMSFAEAVTLPITFLTAYYGLHDLARIQPGDRVLIHAAAGGVGLAAVQLAQRAGAVVFGTAGSPRKRAYLRSIGVQHVMDSRSLDFAAEVMALTNGEGVDIVLNSLADEFIPKSFSVLREGGRFLEIGKRGIWTKAQVAERYPTLAYYPYDLTDALQVQPGFFASTFNQLLPEFESGRLQVLPIQTFPIGEVVEAFRYMAQARHIGKVVITQESTGLDAGPTGIRSDATYLLTGGLGGLGLVIAGSLVESGARHLALVGRRKPSEYAQRLISGWEASGVQVTCVPGDVSKETDVSQILAKIRAEMPPLRGVIHAAGVLDDGALALQSWQRFVTVLAPKAEGAWHLHCQTRGFDLDFFILFSSMAAVLTSRGQGNYAAANAYLDGLAHLRRSQGLPAMSINWGPWSEVGMAAAVGERNQQRWEAQGVGGIAPEEGAQVFKHLLLKNPVQVGVYPIDWKRLSGQLIEGEIQPILQELIGHVQEREKKATAQVGPEIMQQLENALPEDRYDLLMAHVQEQVARVLGLDPAQPVNTSRGLTDLGMDSLMAVELSNRLKQSIGHKLPSTVAFEYPTIPALTTFLAAEVLHLALSTETPGNGDRLQDASDQALVEVEGLSEAEAEASLLKELDDLGF